MISGTGKGRPRGFSLLEILITLGILALFSGYFLLRFDDGDSEELLRESSTGIRDLALKAKKRSHAFRREQYVVFSPGGVVLSDSAAGDRDDSASSHIVDSMRIPAEVRIELLPPGETAWKKLNEYVWTFRDSGLSDPLQIRLSVGRSYTKLSFNVLTARAEEETFLE